MAMLLLASLLIPIIASSAQPTQTNITLGSSLAISDKPWLSPSGRFAFGFYPKSHGFAIGLWLTTAPDRTVVWTAFRDDPPITDGSIRLSFDGRFLWSAPGGNEKVISQATEAVAFAGILDSGNLVLYNSKNRVVWSTFESPTDTLLPGQSLVPLNQLLSSASISDQSTGRFRLNNQNDGNLVLYPVGTSDTADDAYWDIGTFQIGFLLTLNLRPDGVLFVTGNGGNYTKNVTQTKISSRRGGAEIYYRAILDFDGILRVYSHRFSNNENSTTTVEWAALSNRCLVRGVCGLNSYCDLTASGDTVCHCPPGYHFVDPDRVVSGCAKNSTGGDCSTSAKSSSTTMSTMENSTWLDKSYLISPSKKTETMEDCKADCLADCFCEAALFNNGLCSKQMLPLKYGRKGGNDTVLIKVVAMDSDKQAVVYECNDKPGLYTLIASSALAVLAVIVLAVSCFLIFRHRRRGRYSRASLHESFDDEAPVRSYTYKELESATDGFKEELGRGAFGSVFKGALYNGERIIAVKRLEKMVEDGEREFQREVRAIGRTHHRNLVRLLGFCNEGSHRLLVYEYMSNGSLANFLFKVETCPSWETRVRIALNVARGLHYLHEEIDTHIIHCDIKPQNILMDDVLTAKISDFGLAKLLMPNQTRTFTGIRGTRGYLAPEWHKNTPITVKADVYSFGIVLMEIICCRRSMEFEEAGWEYTLSEWMYGCFEAGELEKILVDETADKAELKRMVKVGLWCVQNEPVFRPSMKNVVLMLEGNMNVPLPPPPASMSI